MSQNPYEVGTATSHAQRTRPTRWMIVTGCICLGLAVLSLIATVVVMMWSFELVAKTNAASAPYDLANGISFAMIPSVAAVPLGLVGILFLVLGFVRRRSVTDI